jgi:Zn-finger nucleic acid-binding protein
VNFKGTIMECPVCKQTTLLMMERQGIEIDYCPTCRGVWLDRGELDKIIERSQSYENQRISSAESFLNPAPEFLPTVAAPVQPPQQPYQTYGENHFGRSSDHHQENRFSPAHDNGHGQGGFLKRLFD